MISKYLIAGFKAISESTNLMHGIGCIMAKNTGLRANWETIKQYMPLLIPLLIIQIALFAYALTHALKHKKYKTGTRAMWLLIIVIGFNYLGPILYLLLGKSND